MCFKKKKTLRRQETNIIFIFARVGWKKPLVLTGKNQTEKPRVFKGKTGFSWGFGGFFNFYKDFAKIIYFKTLENNEILLLL
jgi:hypothetical protein